MAVSYQQYTSNTGTGTTPSFAHDAGSGTDRVTVALIEAYYQSPTLLTISSAPTYNGNTLTQKGTRQYVVGPANRTYYSWAYVLDSMESPSGSNTFTLTFGSTCNYIVHVWTFNGADYAGTFNVAGDAQSSGTPVTLTISAGANDFTVMGVGYRDNISGATEDSGATERYDADIGNMWGHAQDLSGALSSISSTPSGSTYYATHALTIPNKAAAGGSIMNQLQFANLGADLYNGTLIG